MKNIKQVLETILDDINEVYKQENRLIERNGELILRVENKATFKDIFSILIGLDNVCFLNFYLEDKETFVIF